MKFPKAKWGGPIPNQTPGAMVRPIMGLVLHIQQGTERGTAGWFHNPAAEASSHFGNPKAGLLDQWVDTADEAWAEMQGNTRWVSVENEGYSGDSLTPSQIENAAQLLAWLNQTEGVPLQISDDPSVRGLGWHGMGGNAWGGHFDCPGDPIKNQRPQIIARAEQILNVVPKAPVSPPKPSNPVPPTPLPIVKIGSTGDVVKRVQTALNENGSRLMVDGVFGESTLGAVFHFQSTHGLSADGVVGPQTYKALGLS